jgi:pimeloyl-ACP methyl ester carboxylesterase
VNTRENDRISWERAREEAGRRGEVRARQDLDAAGPPPYTGAGVFDREFLRLICAERFSAEAAGPSPFRQEALTVLARAPEYTPEDRGMYWKAYAASFDALYPQLADLDLEKTVPRLDVPVHVALGRHDGSTIPEIGERWLRGLDAPAKKLVWFERSGHAPAFEEPEKFVEMLGQMALHARGGGSPIG